MRKLFGGFLRNGWEKVAADLSDRHKALHKAYEDLSKERFDEIFLLATVDVFVEKAQRLLTLRARCLMGAGIITSAFSLGLLCYVAYELHIIKLDSFFIKYEPSDTNFLMALVLKSSTVAAFAVGAIILSAQLSKAFLHEATVLYNRRHALRFGRLFVYLRKGDIELRDLQEAFKWSDEFSTAFKQMQMDNLAKSPLVKLIEAPAEVAKHIAESLKNKKDADAEKK